MATEAQVTRVRQLTDDNGDPPRLTDEELGERIDAGPWCPLPPTALEGTPPDPDLYAIAALVWEDRALELDMARATAPVAEPARVTAERNGDVSKSYGGAGKLEAGAVQVAEPAAMRAVSGRLRKRSCNGPTGTETVALLGPAERVRGIYGDDEYAGYDPVLGFYPRQVINRPGP